MTRMFSKLSAMVLFTMLLSLSAGCDINTVEVNKGIVGSGRLVSESRSLPAFSEITIANFAHVVITQDPASSVRVEADDNIIGLVSSSVSDNVLSVGLPEGSYNNVTVNVYVSMKTIAALRTTGAGSFQTKGSIAADSLFCRIDGAGAMNLEGTAAQTTMQISGAGEIHNFSLRTSRCSVSIEGAGEAEVYANDRLDASIAGAGSIVYDGNPPTVHQSVSGVGSIRPR